MKHLEQNFSGLKKRPFLMRFTELKTSKLHHYMTYEDILQVAGGGIKLGRLSTRIDESNRDHHLWNNRGTWWCHFTLHLLNHTSERVRVSLKTDSVEEARERRDQLLDAVR